MIGCEKSFLIDI